MKHSLPFLSALKKYLRQNVYPFHTPGHKGGRGILTEFAEVMSEALAVDVSLMTELDDIHVPTGVLQDAQNLAAKLYGADKSFFCVNGTSGAIHAMILACVQTGEKLLLPRNAHRSIAGALVISGAQPIYMMPEYDKDFCLATQVTSESIKSKFQDHSDIKAVLITSPNYYGVAAALDKIEKTVHANKAIFLVDEAHGPHLGFSDEFPLPALSCGADAAAQSTHKIVGAMTQCSLLHVKGELIDKEKVKQAMSLLTTTSPNQLLLASLDAAIHQLSISGKQMAKKALHLADYFRAALADIDDIKVFNYNEYNLFDRTKVTVNVSGLGLTGYEAADFLRKQKLAVELADRSNILFLITYADDISEIDAAVQAMKKLTKRKKTLKTSSLPQMPVPQIILTPREAFFRKSEKKLLKDAQGLIATQEMNFYPPGIPVILPGELISKDIVDYCHAHMANEQEFKEKYIDVVR